MDSHAPAAAREIERNGAANALCRSGYKCCWLGVHELVAGNRGRLRHLRHQYICNVQNITANENKTCVPGDVFSPQNKWRDHQGGGEHHPDIYPRDDIWNRHRHDHRRQAHDRQNIEQIAAEHIAERNPAMAPASRRDSRL